MNISIDIHTYRFLYSTNLLWMVVLQLPLGKDSLHRVGSINSRAVWCNDQYFQRILVVINKIEDGRDNVLNETSVSCDRCQRTAHMYVQNEQLSYTYWQPLN